MLACLLILPEAALQSSAGVLEGPGKQFPAYLLDGSLIATLAPGCDLDVRFQILQLGGDALSFLFC